MDTQQRTRLSSSFIVVKIFFILAVIALTLAVFVAQDQVDNKTLVAYFVVSAVFVTLLVFFFTRPNISFDSRDLFIKRIGAEEIAVPLRNIKTISRGFAYRGSANYTIGYNLNKEVKTIKLSKSYPSKKMSAFIALVRQINPHVDTQNIF